MMNNKQQHYIRTVLEEQYKEVIAAPEKFIQSDPIQFPRHFTDTGSDEKEVLISAIITAWFTFGRRSVILQEVEKIHNHMIQRSGSLYAYMMGSEYISFSNDYTSIYRMFKGRDFYHLCSCVEEIIRRYDDLTLTELIENLHSYFYFEPANYHCFGKPQTVNKRLHMLLRWLVRKDPVDIGIWEAYGPEKLLIPLDTHVSTIAGQIWKDLPKGESLKKVRIITDRLKEIDPVDPVKFDLSLFSIGLDKLQIHWGL